MDRRVISNYRQPIILIISNNQTKLPLSSSLLASFDRFQIAFQEHKTLSWIQQHQPDLIILDLEAVQRGVEGFPAELCAQSVARRDSTRSVVQRLRQEESEKLLLLVTTLKLDWLTRDIPIIAIVDSAERQLSLSTDLNYDACLSKPYSVNELERICSLISTDYKFSSKAVQI